MPNDKIKEKIVQKLNDKDSQAVAEKRGPTVEEYGKHVKMQIENVVSGREAKAAQQRLQNTTNE